MNIRKWVDFVLNPKNEEQLESDRLSVYSISCSPHRVSESFILDPESSAQSILESLNDS